MKTYALLFISFFLSINLFAQNPSRLFERVQQAKSELNREFVLIENIFISNKNVSLTSNQFIDDKTISYFDFDKTVYSRLQNNLDKAISLQIPDLENDESQLVLDLIEVSESFSNFSVITSSGDVFNGRDLGGMHYRGIVRGKELNSLVALSVFEDQMSGIISISGQGTINIGKLAKVGQHIMYNDSNLKSITEDICETPENGEQNPMIDDLYSDIFNDSAVNPEDVCLKVYFELDHDIYTYHNNSTVNTANFVIAIFNEVATIYLNESITMEISEIFIWDTPDNYSSSTGTGLSQFVSQRSTFNGDLAHLLTFRSGSLDPNNLSNAGGRANFFGGVCVNGNINLSPHSYTSIFPEFETFPVFSRQVKVITHEIGHNLGSRHTHACVWNQNDTAIDGCSGFTEGNCLIPAPIPAFTGTIMSYCDRSTGIDFTLGFGPQPGNLIRNFVSSLTCVNDCETAPACTLSTNETTINVNENMSSNSISVSSNGDWLVTDNASWISLNTTSGTGNGSIGFTLGANVLSNPRTGVITVSCNQTFKTVTVNQSGAINPPSCNETDSLALVALYNSTDGLNWMTSWNFNQPMANWYGVQLNSQGCVSELDLSDNKLNGSLPPEIGNLINLTSLKLQKNQLIGFVPLEIGNLSNLTYLNLHINQLSGSLPTEISNLSNLTYLNLNTNKLSSIIPSSLGNLSNLTTLILSNNLFTGNIPPELGNLSNLSSLFLQSNKLSGGLPISLATLPNLGSLWLNNNFLSGSIPPEYGNMPSLTNIRLFNNRLSGCYDQNLANLCDLNSYANITSGNNFDASWENFCSTGAGQCLSIPPTCRLSDSLALISLYNSTDGANWTYTWNLNQPIDNWYGVSLNSYGCVSKLNLRIYGLNGTIPAELGNISGLTSLNLHNNQLSGSIPPELGNLPILNYLALYNNQLSGCFDQNLATLCNQLSVDDISRGNNFTSSWADFCSNGTGECNIGSGCRFTDSLALVTLYNSTDGPNWLISWNLNEPMTSWNGVAYNSNVCVTQLNLKNNQLNGTIPSELGSISHLTRLDLNSNQLSGNIPAELGDLSNLTILDLRNNQLSGNIPAELGNVVNLTTLNMHGNQLSGPIPPELGELSNLISMHLYNNQLSGPIPAELGNLYNLHYLNLYNNQLSGTIPPELGNLSSLDYLRLQWNQLSGSIPSELGDLPNLSYLYLHTNQLSGCYDQNLSNLCDQLTSVSVNTGNSFDTHWFDFCNSGAGACTDLVTVTDFPYQEGFETGLGLWIQDSSDDLDWTRNSGTTPSSNTGPEMAARGSYYLYTEATGNNNKQAILLSPRFDLSQVVNPILIAKYHMYGSNMGTLVFEASTDNGSSWNLLAEFDPGQGFDKWVTFAIYYSLNNYASETVQLRMIGTVGDGYESDIAVDDINILSITNDDNIFCPELLSLTDPILDGNHFQAIDYVSANGMVLTGNEVTIKSGKNIELLSGFEVENAAVFNAVIGACQ